MFPIHPENKCLMTGTVSSPLHLQMRIRSRYWTSPSPNCKFGQLAPRLPNSFYKRTLDPFPGLSECTPPPLNSFPAAFPKAFCFLSASWICLLLNGNSFQKAFTSRAWMREDSCRLLGCTEAEVSLKPSHLYARSPYCMLDLSPAAPFLHS